MRSMEPQLGDILVVDDSELIHKFQGLVARRLGLTVSHAYNGLEALQLTRKKRFRAILLDLNMPVLDGLSFLETLRKEEFGDPVPVVVVSTENQDEDIRRALERGATAYLKKPFTVEQIAEVLQRVLNLPSSAAAR
nr:MAG: response regulator [Pseudomonadota bacterium]